MENIYDQDYAQVEKVYTDVLKVLKKNKDIVDLKVRDVEVKRDVDLLKIKLYKLFGCKTSVGNPNYVSLQFEYTHYIKWSENMNISCSDNGEQPKTGEELIAFSYSTGAYIFGGHYPVETFKEFFEELKSYDYKYIDTANSSLYLTLEHGTLLLSNYKEIFDRYRELSIERNKENKRQELLKQLAEL